MPDPNVFIQFFKHKKRAMQRGKGDMLAIKNEDGSSKLPSSESVNVQLVSPVEAEKDRAASTLSRIKARHVRPSHRRKTKSTGKRSPLRRRGKYRSRTKKKLTNKRSKTTRKKPVKRKINNRPTIFD